MNAEGYNSEAIREAELLELGIEIKELIGLCGATELFSTLDEDFDTVIRSQSPEEQARAMDQFQGNYEERVDRIEDRSLGLIAYMAINALLYVRRGLPNYARETFSIDEVESLLYFSQSESSTRILELCARICNRVKSL